MSLLCMPLCQVGGEFAVSKAEQKRQIEALRTLNSCLSTLAADEPQLFEGDSLTLILCMQHHADIVRDRTALHPVCLGSHRLEAH